jgi:hypothetical protein
MRPKGEDVAAATVDWAKDEIKKGPSDLYDLGKFFFGASTATLGGLAGIAKLDANFAITHMFAASALLLLVSAVVAVLMVRPRVWTLDQDCDLFEQHARKLRSGLRYTWLWFLMWLAGALMGIDGVFPALPANLASLPAAVAGAMGL